MVHKLHKYVIWNNFVCQNYFLSAMTYEVREKTDHYVELLHGCDVGGLVVIGPSSKFSATFGLCIN